MTDDLVLPKAFIAFLWEICREVEDELREELVAREQAKEVEATVDEEAELYQLENLEE